MKPTIILFIVLASILNSCRTSSQQIELPEMTIQTTKDGSAYKTSEIPEDKTIMVLYFHPDCHSCQEETKSITDSIDLFKNIRILMVSLAPIELIESFSSKYQIGKYSNIVIGRDIENKFGSIFKTTTIPMTAIFDSSKVLRIAYKGELPLSAITNALKF